MKILKKYRDYIFQNKINESVEAQGYQVVPNGAQIPTKGVVKFGIDPTSSPGAGSGMHLGHLVPIRMVRKLKESGMTVRAVIGTFTSCLGDPSGKDRTREMQSLEKAKQNAEPILAQIKRIVGDDIEIFYNHEWFNKMTLPDFMNILSKFTVDYLLSRDAFQKRKESGGTVGAHEIIVPLLQGIDSYELKADVEVGGSDQLFNFLLSRDIQEKLGQKPEICLLAPIINGTNGQKMSKSSGNCIFLNDPPKDVFGKAMSITDEVMYQWIPIFMEGTDVKKHPMELKKELATVITNEIWPGKGEAERKSFEATVQNKALPTDIPEIEMEADFLGTIAKMAKVSRGEARRLIQSNAVSVNDEKILDQNYLLNPGDLIKVGKRNYAKIITK